MTVEELMKYMLNLFNNTSDNLHNEYEKLSKKDMELSDLDHYIEIHNLKAPQLAKIGRLRKTLRQERREIKNNIEMIEIVKKFTDKYNNKLITGDIIQVVKNLRTLEKNNKERTYNPRVIKKLKCTEAKDEQNRNTI